MHMVPRVSENADPVSLDAISRLVFSMVDGVATVAELANFCGLDEDIAARVVGDLVARGILSLPSGPTIEPEGPAGSAAQGDGGDGGGAIGEEEEDEDEFGAEIRILHGALGEKNYYEILQVEPDADRKALRSAYFSMSKRFHPDRAFGKSRIEMRRKMDVIFRELTRAYDILSSNSSRKEYDKQIAEQINLWRIEKQLSQAVSQERSLRQPAAGASTSGGTSSGPSPTHSKAPVRRGPVVKTTVHPRTPTQKVTVSKPRSARRRKTTGARGSSSPPTPDGVRGRQSSRRIESKGGAGARKSSEPPEGKGDREARRERWRREKLGRALGMAIQPNSIAPPDKTRKSLEGLIDHARIALEQDEHEEAVRLLKRVLDDAPDDKVALAMVEKAEAGAARSVARSCLSRGQHERRHGNLEAALTCFERALEAEQSNLEAKHLVSDVLLELRRELPRALTLSKEVVTLSGQRARYLATLGELLILAKEKTRARDVFERALALEPDNKDLKKRLKACKA